jgi:hypothetical protein
MSERQWNKLLREVRKNEPHVQVGVISGKGGEADHGDDDLTVLFLATVHEFGAPGANIPSRSFIRSTVDENQDELKELIGKLVNRMIEHGDTQEHVLEILGQWLTAKIKAKITSNIPPPLKESTIEAKGSSIALVDTGQLLNSITYEVKGAS